MSFHRIVAMAYAAYAAAPPESQRSCRGFESSGGRAAAGLSRLSTKNRTRRADSGASKTADIATRCAAHSLTDTSYDQFIASTLLIAASTISAPSVVVRRQSSRVPPRTSASPANARYEYE